MKSFLITLLVWGASFAGIYYGYHRVYYPPGDWTGALIVSFFLAIGIGALRKSRIDRREAAIVSRPEGPPADGERVAISGTLEPTGAPLHAPFSGLECVAWDYSVHHTESSRGGSSTSSTQVPALMRAAADGRTDVVRLLIDRGARINDVNTDKQSALALAIGNGHNDIADMLRKAGAK